MPEDMTGMIEWSIMDTIGRYMMENGTPRYWDSPLVAFADANSPLFPQLKTICCPEHKVPQDYLPEAETVISYFLPFKEKVAETNIGGELPSKEWVDSYNTTNAMAVRINEDIVSLLEGMGHRAVAPPDAGIIINGGFSVWSQRHVAWIAGLGTFGMNNMLITEKGCCGRFFSVITDMPHAHGERMETERCPYRRDGSCGICIDRCITNSLGDDGFKRPTCYDICMGNKERCGADICGKCVVGLPCSHKAP